MAYAKLPLVCGDYPLGYQDVNQAMDNCDAILATWNTEHGTSQPGQGVVVRPWDIWGRHDDYRIARTLVRVQNTASGTTPFTIAVQGRAISAVTKVGTGQWTAQIEGGVGTVRAVAQVEAANNTPTRHHTVYVYGSTIYVTTYDLTAGAFVATDLDFTLVVWGA